MSIKKVNPREFMIYEICASLATLGFIVLVVYFVRTLIAVRQSLKIISAATLKLGTKIDPLTDQALDILQNTNKLTASVNDQIAAFDPLLNTISDLGCALHKTTHSLNEESQQKKNPKHNQVEDWMEIAALGVILWQQIKKGDNMPHRRTTNKVIRPHQQTEVSHLLLSAAAGGLVGLAAALLFAPKAGSRLRQDLLDTYQDILDKGGKAASCAADYAEELKDTAASYMPRSKPKDSNLPIIIGALGGAILGTAAAYLAIPKDEEEEAHSITEKLRGASKSVADNIQSIDWIGTAKDVLSALNEKVNHNHNGSKAEPLEEIAEENNLDEILDWASLGLRVWQNIKKRS